MTRAAERTVRRTVQRNCAALPRVKYSGCSRKLTSCTLTITGTRQPIGAVYCTCSRSGASCRSFMANSNPRRKNGFAEIGRVATRRGIHDAAFSADTYATNSDS